jgi:hypothetical protein
MRFRAFVVASLFVIPTFVALSPTDPLRGSPQAEASVSMLLSLDEIVAPSTAIVVGTASERKAQWEEIAGGRRIVTYTKIKIDRTIAGSAGTEVWVRTLGGTIGNLGQAVSGEAQIATGSKAMLFLMKRGDVTVVTAMAQGHYPILADDKGVSRLRPSPDVGTQLRQPGPVIAARDLLVGEKLETAVTAISKARKAIDEKKK